jgi:hypothetical protein
LGPTKPAQNKFSASGKQGAKTLRVAGFAGALWGGVVTVAITAGPHTNSAPRVAAASPAGVSNESVRQRGDRLPLVFVARWESNLPPAAAPVTAPETAAPVSEPAALHQVVESIDQPRQHAHVKKRSSVCGVRGRYYFTRDHHRFWKCRR